MKPLSRFKWLLVPGILLIVFAVAYQLFDTRFETRSDEARETLAVNDQDFRDLITDRIVAGNLDCNFALKIEELACLAFQAAVGAYEAKGFAVGQKKSYAAHRENISTLYAIEVTNQIVTVLPGSRYMLAYRAMGLEDIAHPGTDAELCLDLGYGACGNHVATFLELTRLMGIVARPVQFFYSKPGRHHSHIVAEAHLNGAWRFFDVTWGAFYAESRDIYRPLSTEQIIALDAESKTRLRISYDTNVFGMVERQKTDVHEYLSHFDSLIYGYDSGEIWIGVDRFSDDMVNLGDIPGFIGDNQDDGAFEGIRYTFENPPLQRMSVTVSGVGGCADDSRICLNKDCREVKALTHEFQGIPAGAQLRIEATLPVCYAVLQSITYDSENQTSK